MRFLHQAPANISISDWIQISISIFAFLAIIFALFGEKIRWWLFGPKIIIEFDKKNERCFREAIVLQDVVQDSNELFKNVRRQYFRLRVSNQGSSLAEELKAKVELYFIDKTLANRFEPSALRWVTGLETVDLAPKEDEYLNFISQVIEHKFEAYRLRIELVNKVLRGIAWDRDFHSWILKVSIHGKNIYTPIVKFFQFDPVQNEASPGNLTEIYDL